MGFEVRIRRRWRSGGAKTAMPSGTFSSSHAASFEAVSRQVATSPASTVSAFANEAVLQNEPLERHWSEWQWRMRGSTPMRLRIARLGA